MLQIIGRSASGEELPDADAREAAREIADVICRYLRKAADASRGAAEPCVHEVSSRASGEDCLRLKLACPKAALGVTVCVFNGQHEGTSLC